MIDGHPIIGDFPQIIKVDDRRWPCYIFCIGRCGLKAIWQLGDQPWLCKKHSFWGSLRAGGLKTAWWFEVNFFFQLFNHTKRMTGWDDLGISLGWLKIIRKSRRSVGFGGKFESPQFTDQWDCSWAMNWFWVMFRSSAGGTSWQEKGEVRHSKVIKSQWSEWIPRGYFEANKTDQFRWCLDIHQKVPNNWFHKHSFGDV